jgi:hypothetical protein
MFPSTNPHHAPTRGSLTPDCADHGHHRCCCRTLALILPDAVQHTGQIMNAIYSSGFSIM